MKHNFVPALIALGATVMAFHCGNVRWLPYPNSSWSIWDRQNNSYFSWSQHVWILTLCKRDKLVFHWSIVHDYTSFWHWWSKHQCKCIKSKANFLDMAELVINFYNGARTANCLKGSKKPLSLPLVATNFMFKHDARYTNMLIVTSVLQL